MVSLLVDTDAFLDAGRHAGSVAGSVGHAIGRAASGLAPSNHMAGSDSNGLTWARSYDQACASLFTHVAHLQDAAATLSRKLATTGYYYELTELANAGVTGVAIALPAPTTPNTGPYIPSSAGGQRKFPDAGNPAFEWVAEQIANLIGDMWPDGDTAKLNAASTVWHRLADDLDDAASGLTNVTDALDSVDTPELSKARAEVEQVRTLAKKIATACRSVGKACNDLSGQISHVHLQTEITLGITITAIVATVAAGAGLTPITFGLSDLAAAGGAAAEVAGAVGTITGFIAELASSISVGVGLVAESAAGLVGISAETASAIGVVVGDLSASAVLWGAAGAVENVGITALTQPGGDLVDAAADGFINGGLGGAVGGVLGRASEYVNFGGGSARSLLSDEGADTGWPSPEITHGVRFFGGDQVGYYTAENATLGRPGDAIFLMPEQDAAKVLNGVDAAIRSGLAPSVTNAVLAGEDVYGALIPLEGIATRTATVVDANGWPHFILGGNTGANIDGIQIVTDTREFVVDGGIPLPSGTVVFKLLDGGGWDILGIVG